MQPHLGTYLDRSNFLLVDFPPAKFAQILFRVRPTDKSAGRTIKMRLNEARNVDTFWVDMIDQLC